MFNPAEAPSPKGWSKRQANASVRNARRDHQNELSRIRFRYLAAVKAGFASIEEHDAHLAARALGFPDAAAHAAYGAGADRSDAGSIDPPQAVAAAPEDAAEPEAADGAPADTPEPAKAGRGRRKAA